jgi:CHAT domain
MDTETRASRTSTAQPTAAPVARLAELVGMLEDNRQRCAHMRQLLEPLQRGGVIAVAGESELLAALEDRLERAQTAMRDLTDAKGRRIDSELDTLESLLIGVDWDLGRELQTGLEAKQQSQDEAVREYDSQTRDWRARVNRLKDTLNVALVEGALVASETEAIRTLEDLVMQAERALREQRYGEVSLPLHRLTRPVAPAAGASLMQASTVDSPTPAPTVDPRSVEQLAEDISSKTLQARELARRAELLLLGGPLVGNRVEYTLLLSAPSAPGSHGINIQGSRTLVKQDRALVREIIDRVTASVNTGIQRRSAAAARTLLLDKESDLESTGSDLTDQIRDVGDLMYRLFVPDPVQRLLADSACSFTITTNDLELPWELMHDGEDFLCVQRPVGRMPMGRAFPRRARWHERIRNRLRFLLIYADPHGDLGKAKVEVESVERALKDKWKDRIEIQLLMGSGVTGRAMNDALRGGGFDVIHYAGHAAFEAQNPELSGLLLHDDEVFFAQKIQSLVEGQPLVFLNACESSRTANEQDVQTTGYLAEPAEGLAAAFVYGGALGCIGALWPVYDQGAADFAVEFYNRLLEGNLVGEALRLARAEIRRQRPEEITWASYVLYGDPTFRLARPSEANA